MVGGGGSKIVATLRADCKVYPTPQGASMALANLVNYKIRTEGEIANKSLSTLSVPTTVMDLGKQLLQYARDSNVKGVKNTLCRGAPFTSDWLGMSALHFAAMNNQYEMCEMLLEGGINKDSKTKVDRTPLHFACYHGNEEIVRLLVSKNCSINARDMLRMTPLQWAIQNRHKAVALFLLQNNADVAAINKFGRTAMGLAVLTEQADLLGELRAASQAQANKKYNEQHEKETSEAVNSIMGLTHHESENANKMDINDDENTNQSEYVAARIQDLENIKETGILGSSTINLLKSHGISMMADDDTSKDMLNTALQNGRQLILSEGGKLLLNETKKIQTNNNNNNNSFNKMNLNKSLQKPTNTIVPTKHTYVTASGSSNVSKLKPNIISKAKDTQQMAKQNSIRIISLNDFKKLYSSKSLKTVPKILPTIVSHQRLVNVRPQTVPSKQMKTNLRSESSSHELIQEQMQVDEEEDMSQYIQLTVADNDEDISGTEIQTQQQQKQPNIIKISSQQQTPAMIKYPVRLVPSKRVDNMGAIAGRQATAAKILKTDPPNKAVSTTTTTTTVVPLLTTTEICRQLLELRKQNEDLRRKFELVQKENEEMRQRIERLEVHALVDKTERDYTN